jgi:RNA polymerase sigma-70 factor (ECF subfamily)
VQDRRATDIALVQAVAAGDQVAIAELYDRHASAVFGMAMSLLRERGLAQDVTQEAFVHLWTRAGMFDSRRGTPLAWLLTMTRNLALDELRRQRRGSERLDRYAREAGLHELETADPLLDQGWQSERVLDALAELSSVQRNTVELVYLHGCTLAEAAERLGVAVGTVKSRLHAALLSLRAALAEKRTAEGASGLRNP